MFLTHLLHTFECQDFLEFHYLAETVVSWVINVTVKQSIPLIRYILFAFTIMYMNNDVIL